MKNNELRDWVVFYKTNGFSFFPCRYRSKRPKIEWSEFRERKPTEEEIGEWLKNPTNIAVVCGEISGNLLVIDFESEDAYEEFMKSSPIPLEETFTVRTYRGYHIYIRTPKPVRGGKKSEDIDVRGEGQYVLAPPSVHPEGVTYELISDCEVRKLSESEWKKLRIYLKKRGIELEEVRGSEKNLERGELDGEAKRVIDLLERYELYKEGYRDRLLYPYQTALFKMGYSLERVKQLTEHIARHFDDDVKERVRQAEYQYKYFKEGKNVAGWSKVEEVVAELKGRDEARRILNEWMAIHSYHWVLLPPKSSGKHQVSIDEDGCILIDGKRFYSLEEVEDESLRDAVRSFVQGIWSGEGWIEFIGRTLDRMIVRDENLKWALLLTCASTYVRDPDSKSTPLNLLVLGDSSTGKSYNATSVSSLFPERDVIKIAGASKKSWFYNFDYHENGTPVTDFTRKIVILLEHDKEILETIKPLLSHDDKEMVYQTVTKSGKGNRGLRVLLRGWPAFVFCTANGRYGEEIVNRCLTVSPESDPEKIGAVLDWDTKREIERLGTVPGEILKTFFLSVRGKRYRVFIPFIDQIQKQLQPFTNNPRIMRDYKKLKGLTRAAALLNVYRRRIVRDSNGDEWIIAEPEDYYLAYEIFRKSLRTTLSGLSEHIIEWYERVFKSLAERKDIIYVEDLVEETLRVQGKKLSRITLRLRRIEPLVEAGWIEKIPDEHDRRRVFYRDLGPSIPELEEVRIEQYDEEDALYKKFGENIHVLNCNQFFTEKSSLDFSRPKEEKIEYKASDHYNGVESSNPHDHADHISKPNVCVRSQPPLNQKNSSLKNLVKNTYKSSTCIVLKTDPVIKALYNMERGMKPKLPKRVLERLERLGLVEEGKLTAKGRATLRHYCSFALPKQRRKNPWLALSLVHDIYVLANIN